MTDLEVVEVDQQARQRAAAARGAVDLLAQAPAHGAVVHRAGDRVGPGLGPRLHERHRGRRLLAPAHWRARRRRARAASAERRTSITTACASPRSASASSRAQLTGPGLGQPRHAGGELVAVGGQEAAPGGGHPVDARGPVGARDAIAEAPLALEQVHDDQLVAVAAGGLQVVDVDLVAAGRAQQLARRARGRSPPARRRCRRSRSAGGCRRTRRPPARRLPLRSSSRHPFPTPHPCPQNVSHERTFDQRRTKRPRRGESRAAPGAFSAATVRAWGGRPRPGRRRRREPAPPSPRRAPGRGWCAARAIGLLAEGDGLVGRGGADAASCSAGSRPAPSLAAGAAALTAGLDSGTFSDTDFEAFLSLR